MTDELTNERKLEITFEMDDLRAAQNPDAVIDWYEALSQPEQEFVTGMVGGAMLMLWARWGLLWREIWQKLGIVQKDRGES